MKTRFTAALGRRSALFAVALLIALFACAPAAAVGATGGAGQVASPPPGAASGSGPFNRQGMWIWYVDRSEGGSIPRIVTRAKAAGIGTLYVKSGDGSGYWSQFSSSLVGALHRAGLDVCAWQYVYGERPLAEAKVGAAAVKRGADCLVIDAESQYEGRYAAAQRYVRALRARIGAGFPLSLAGFPYVDYHPAFPYSVFFGPEGADANQPQMYWKAIGTSVRAVYEHTYVYNRLWGRPIYPVGQTYEAPRRGEVLRFRRFAASYGGLAPSWWDWQETGSRTWGALGAALRGPLSGYRPVTAQPLLRRGSRGDLVVWAQEHLVGAGETRLPVTGIYGKQTVAAVKDFQQARGLTVDGAIGKTTWNALLNVEPVEPSWVAPRTRAGAAATSRALGGAASISARVARRPASASIPAKAYEIEPSPAHERPLPTP